MEWADMDITMCANSALVFLKQGESLIKLWKKQSMRFLIEYMAPCTMNLSLSCELYLKALIATEMNNKAPKTHLLELLFEQLSVRFAKMREEIEAEYKAFSPRLSFEDCISVHNNAFVDWRYYYEEGNNNGLQADPPSLYYLAVSLNHVYCKRETNHAD